jgi:biopolymer transport protein ExbD
MRKKFARKYKPTELLLVPMIDIFTVLVTFLLMTAVFSRITIIELDLPSSASAPSEPRLRLEVIVRKLGFELTNGSALIATIPKLPGGEYDFATLSQLAVALKRDHPDADDASVLLEPDIEYDQLVQVMDAIRSTELPLADASGAAPDAGSAPAAPAGREVAPAPPTRVALFTDIAVGDAP